MGVSNIILPLGVFEGKGSVEGAPPRTDQLVFIDEPRLPLFLMALLSLPATTPVTGFQSHIEGSTFDRTRFRFNGTRVFNVLPPVTVTATPTPAADTTDTTLPAPNRHRSMRLRPRTDSATPPPRRRAFICHRMQHIFCSRIVCYH